jgi:hypothetical protein
MKTFGIILFLVAVALPSVAKPGQISIREIQDMLDDAGTVSVAESYLLGYHDHWFDSLYSEARARDQSEDTLEAYVECANQNYWYARAIAARLKKLSDDVSFESWWLEYVNSCVPLRKVLQKVSVKED